MLGDTLRAEREKQNLTIKDIENGTSIRALYIESIETGEYAKLPGEVYTKGFIRNYANFLKLDATALLKQYVEENHPAAVAVDKELAPAESKRSAASSHATSQSDAKARSNGSAHTAGADFRQRVQSSHKRQNLLLLVVVVLAVVSGAYYLMSRDDSAVSKKPVPVTQQAKTPQPNVPAAPPADAAKKIDGIELGARFTDRCWTQVIVDGKTVYEGTMEKGKTETWQGKEKIVITAGNASAVEVKLNGKELGKLGDKGQVVEKTYMPDGPAADSTENSNKDSRK